MRRLFLAALAVTLAASTAARAADPIMPLAEVQPGLRCTGLSVVRGLEIASFDVEVIDVIDRERGHAARIIVRVSGPAVDATGLGPGFSGSPIICPGADGVGRNIGAISETVGEYGGRTALATPIEAVLAQPVLPPAATRSAAPARSSIIGARSLAGPMTIAGLRPSLARSFVRAARKAGRVLLASPAGTRAAFAPQPLVPGASVSVGLTSGDVAVGSLGTVAYADGASAWIYGHPLDGAGRRSLFLQDAYVHTVVNNPVAAPDVSTYKLGSPGNDVGTIASDGPTAVVGTLGAPPPSFPLRVTAKDLDTGRVGSSLTHIADEGDVGLPTGATALGITAAAAAAESSAAILGGAPARQSAALCMKASLRELRKPLRVCWDYAVDGASQNALAGAVAADVASAVGTDRTPGKRAELVDACTSRRSVMARASPVSVLETRLRELDSDDPWTHSGPSDPRLQHFIMVMSSFTDARMEQECSYPAVLSPERADRVIECSELLRDIASDERHLVSGPLQRTMQHRIATGRHGAEPPAANRLHELYTATATRAGPSMWRTYLNIHYEPYPFPLPWRTWLLKADPDAPVLEIAGAQEWTDLVERYPADGAAGLVGPDWVGASREYAGVHLTLSGIVAVQGFSFPTSHGGTAPEYWDVESTRWLSPRLSDPMLVEVATEVPSEW